MLKRTFVVLAILQFCTAQKQDPIAAPTASTEKPPVTDDSSEDLQQQINDLEEQVAFLTEIVNQNKESVDTVEGNVQLLQNDVQNLEEELDTVVDTINVNNAMPLCQDYYEAGVRESGFYQIDPDGDEGSMQPFEVYCDFDSNPDEAITKIGHNSEERTLVSGCEDPGCYSKDIEYLADMPQMIAVIAASKTCQQYAKYECFDSMLFYYEDEAWWLSRDYKKQSFWAGAPEGSKMCKCGADKTCDGNSTTCNCDNNDAVWREDDGYFTEMDLLPVMQLNFGDTEAMDERGFHTLGKLECTGKAIHQSCATLKQNGYASGNNTINPTKLVMNAFDVYCDMDSYPGTGITVINHDSSSAGPIYGNSACTYDRNVDYGVSMDKIESLINISSHCTQYIYWRCLRSGFLRQGRSWWLSRQGEKMTYWGGATPGHNKYCACGETGTCAGGGTHANKCNCDAGDSTWRIDSGNLIDKNALPVSGLHFSFNSCSSSYQGYYELGPLKCF